MNSVRKTYILSILGHWKTSFFSFLYAPALFKFNMEVEDENWYKKRHFPIIDNSVEISTHDSYFFFFTIYRLFPSIQKGRKPNVNTLTAGLYNFADAQRYFIVFTLPIQFNFLTQSILLYVRCYIQYIHIRCIQYTWYTWIVR